MTTTLSEAESRRMVADHGVPVSRFVTAADAGGVVAAVAGSDMGYPVVVKLCGRSIAHKTERGLVRLDVDDESALLVAADELLGAATGADGPVELLVSEMISGSRELIAGVVRDPQWGLVMMLGIGGIFAEAIRDVAFRLLPVNEIDAAELVDDLGTQSLLGEVRGEPPVDRDALVATLLALGRAAEAAPGVVSIDLNPLIVASGRPVAVDALVELDDTSPAA